MPGLPGGGLAFGSEPKAVLCIPRSATTLDLDSLASTSSMSMCRRRTRSGAGCGNYRAGICWSGNGASLGAPLLGKPFPLPEATSEPIEQAARRFWPMFREAVARHRRSDVPLGVFLSGGIDSSSVAAALCEIEPAGQVHTFSIGFEDPSFDESPHARAVARHLGTDHHERTFSVEQVYELLPEVAVWLDEPFGDASILPTHLLSRFARGEVKVVLGGDGADELLAGYPTFEAEQAAGFYRRLPKPARALAEAAVGRLPVDHRNFSFDFKLKQFLRGGRTPVTGPSALARLLSGPELDRLLISHAQGRVDVEAEHLALAAALAPWADSLNRSLALYQETYLPEDILTKVDRASMACGLEVRAPFLDAVLVDAVQKLPAHFKYGQKMTKRLLKCGRLG